MAITLTLGNTSATTPAAAPLGNCTVNPYGSTPTTSNTILSRLMHTRILRSRYPALTPPTTSIARQQAIENALSMALHYVRTTDTQQGIQAATAKAIRAATMLKQACTESTINVGAL